MAEADRGLPGQVTIAVNMANPSGVQLNIVEQRLSAERLGPYRAAVGGDLAEALALYRWNILLSGAFYELLQDTEVVLRNAIHAQLTGHNGGNGFWFQRPGWFTSGTNTEITQARQRVRRSGQVETPGHIVAELNFGFWRFLLTRQYDRRLWVPCLHRAFPHSSGRRADIHDAVAAAHTLRNRIAHHEPIHSRPHTQDEQTLLTLIGWICPDTQAWVETQNRLPHVLQQKP